MVIGLRSDSVALSHVWLGLAYALARMKSLVLCHVVGDSVCMVSSCFSRWSPFPPVGTI